MANDLDGIRVAILVTDGFEQSELEHPKRSLEQNGAQCDIVSPKNDTVRGWQHVDWGDEFDVDVPLSQASLDDYDALVLPGGQINPDKLRSNADAVDFARRFVKAGRPVAAVCHGPWLLIEAGVVRGRKMTSYHSIRTDLQNAGAEVVDASVVVDGNLITSRNPDDLDAFSGKLIEVLRKQAGLAGRAGHEGAEATGHTARTP